MSYFIINHHLLRKLKSRGFNVLTPKDVFQKDYPIWIPEKIDRLELLDIYDGLLRHVKTPGSDKWVLVIDDAIEKVPEKDLVGDVLLTDESMNGKLRWWR